MGWKARSGLCEDGGVVPAKHPPMRDSAEACYWTGYTYRFWNFKTGEASRDIYRMADYRTMDRAYAGYHTLSCDMAVDRLREDFLKQA